MKNPSSHNGRSAHRHHDRKRTMHARERAVTERERSLRTRQKLGEEHDRAIAEREKAIALREQALHPRAETDATRTERERLMVQMRESNERLIAATLHADELTEQAIAAHAIASEIATTEAQGRRHAEILAAQLLASERALRESESEAQASSRAKDDFLAMLGHELRNPLAPIRLALDLIAMDSNDSHKREHTIIDHQVRQLVRLVDELLDISRIRSGKIQLRREPLELAEVVSRAVEVASPLIEAKGHALTVNVAQHGLRIDGDLLRLTQAVGNVLTNAAKYTPDGGSIVVTGERRGPMVSLRVRDNGIGIAKEMLPRMFDLFVQAEQPASGGPGGLGLGLAIVRSLIAAHDGTVTAHSEGLGRGSELVIEIPALVHPSESQESTGSRSRALKPIARRILTVDDNRLVAELTRIALAALGHDVRVAFDGPSALSVVDGFVPDVVLLDLDLPGMDGYEVAKRLRAVLSSHEVHFIAITGYGKAADRQRSADEGFDDHLVKPVDLATLRRSIEKIAMEHRLARGVDSPRA